MGIFNFFSNKNRNQETESPPSGESDSSLKRSILQEDQHENLQYDKSVLDDLDGAREQRLHRAAEKQIQTAAEDSIKKLHLIRMGRCPACGEHLRQHLFASICEACGWHTFDVPREGPVRVHLRNGDETIDGERCYMVKTGSVLMIRNDLVVAKIPRDAFDWIEYVWDQTEIDQRHKQVVDRMHILCDWCNEAADPEKDGFHMVQVAFGASQERYCLCSDECYEAFRKMYPARVHRNCYERNCAECNLCIKRYGGEAEGLRLLAKDYLTVARNRKPQP